jgi:hypothetical protein
MGPNGRKLRASSVTLLAAAFCSLSTFGQTRLPQLDELLARGCPTHGGGTQVQHAQGCSPGWQPAFGGRDGTDGLIRASTVFDDGSGPALIVGGTFTSAGGALATNVARWDGAHWSALGAGLPGEVKALAVHDDGSGPALYAAGELEASGGLFGNVARWNGATWVDVGFSGPGRVEALISHTDGAGRALFAGGQFVLVVGGAAVSINVARLSNGAWSSMPGASVPTVLSFATFDDGQGPALVVGGEGDFQLSGATSRAAAKWSNGVWSPIGGPALLRTKSLAVVDDGAGPVLYAAGASGSIQGSPLVLLTSTPQGASWVGVATPPGVTNIVAVGAFDAGSGERLHAIYSNAVQRLDGGFWTTTVELPPNSPPTSGPVAAGISVFDAGGGAALHVFGAFGAAPEDPLHHIARVVGNTLQPLGVAGAIERPAHVAVAFGVGSARRWVTPRLRTNVAGAATWFLDAWDGAQWTTLGEVSGGEIEVLEARDFGAGAGLYAGGTFDTIGGVAARGIARWDGAAWSALGSGIEGRVRALAFYDAGQGPRLYAGGRFNDAGGVVAVNIAAWDGVNWSEVGGGTASWGNSADVITLEAFDLFGASSLYVGGDFAFVGGQQAISIASWNGAVWSALGGGLPLITFPGRVQSLARFDDGTAPALYAAGLFLTPGSQFPFGIARWDGQQWSTVGGAHTYPDPVEHRLHVFDDGEGPGLVLGAGTITTQDGIFHGVARWDGTRWRGIGAGLPGNALSLSVYDDGAGRALYIGGDFAGSHAGDAYVALWRGCAAAIGGVYCTPAVVNSTGVFADLSASGSTLVAEDDVTLVAQRLPLNSFGVFLVGTTRALVPGYNGSVGALCLGGGIGLYTRPGEVLSSGLAGELALGLDLASTPVPGGATSVMPGDTWHFQVWYRDTTLPGPVSNFSSGLTLQFE